MQLPSQAQGAGYYQSPAAFGDNTINYFYCPFCGLVFNAAPVTKHCGVEVQRPQEIPTHNLWQQETASQ